MDKRGFLALIVLLLVPSVTAFDISIKDDNLIINGEFNEIKVYHEYEENGYKADLVKVINFDGDNIYDLNTLLLPLDESYYFLVCSVNERDGCRVINFGYKAEGVVVGKGLHQECKLNQECVSGNCVGPEPFGCCEMGMECYFNNECYDIGKPLNKEYICSNLNEFKNCKSSNYCEQIGDAECHSNNKWEKRCEEQGMRCVNGGCVVGKIAVAEEAPAEEIIAGETDPCVGEGIPCKYGWRGYCTNILFSNIKIFIPVWRCDGECVNGKCPPSELKITSTEGMLFPCPDYGSGIRIEWEAVIGAVNYRIEYYDNGKWNYYINRNVTKNPEVHFEKDGKIYGWVNFVQLPNTKKCVVDREDFIDPFSPKTGCSGDYNFKDILIENEEACRNLCNKISGATCCQINKGKTSYCHATNGNTMFFNSKDVLAVSRRSAQICNRCLEPTEIKSIRIKAQDADNNDLTEWSTILVGLDDLKEIECKGKEYYWSKIEGNPECYGNDKKTEKERVINIMSFDETNKLMEDYIDECGCNENDNVNYKQIPIWNMRLTAREQCLINEKCYNENNMVCDNLGCASKLVFMPFAQKVTVEEDIPNLIFTNNFVQYYTCDGGQLLKQDIQGKTLEECRDICEITAGAKCCQYNEGFSSIEYPEFKIKYSHCFV